MNHLVEMAPAEGMASAEPAKPAGMARTLVSAIALLLLGAVIGMSAWALFGPEAGPQGQGLVFVIPEGSSSRVVAGVQSAIQIPTDIRFEKGEVAAITIINEDTTVHRAGPFLVGPGETYTQRFPRPGSYPINCAVDPSESVVVTVGG